MNCGLFFLYVAAINEGLWIGGYHKRYSITPIMQDDTAAIERSNEDLNVMIFFFFLSFTCIGR